MDNITHTLIGVGMARAGLSQRFGRGVTMILAIASNLPDLDVACLAGGPLAFLWRRTPTHSLLGALLLVFLAGLLFHRFYPHLSWPVVFGLTALGISGHVFADLWNSYGVVLFWPFSWQRVELDWVFIIDLMIWGILGSSLVAGLLFQKQQVWIWRAGLVLLAVYIGVCAQARRVSGQLLQEKIRSERVAASAEFLCPEPFGPQRFRGIVRESEGYLIYALRPFEHTIERVERVETDEKSLLVKAVRRTQAGRKLDWFFSTPVWGVAPGGQAALVYGLKFRSSVLKGRAHFFFRLTPDGRVSRAG